MLVVALVLVAGLAFAGGEKETADTATTAPGEPQYGGTINYLSIGSIWGEPTNPDIGAGFMGTSFQYLFPMLEMPFIGDIEKFGPRGTDEFKFDVQAFIPEQFLTGRLLVGWESTPEKLTWKIRQGVYWAPNEEQQKWMKVREMTAEDVVADLLYYREAPGGKSFKKHSGNVYATDKYTVVIEWKTFMSNWMYILGYEDRAMYTPPEMNEQGPEKWENQVGTGAFRFKEYVPGSYMSFTKNPNWWKTTTIDGKEYKLPFVDELVLPIILDISTHIAALRTGKIDVHAVVLPQEWEALAKTAPKLIAQEHIGKAWTFNMNVMVPPLNDVNVRRALMIGTNLKELAEVAGAENLPIHWFPISWADTYAYTPIDKLPAESRKLYDYNPELAKKMLKEAGVSNLKVIGNLEGGEVEAESLLSLLKDQWTKIGVDLELNAMDGTAMSKMFVSKKLQPGGSTTGAQDIANPSLMYRYFHTDGIFNGMGYSSAANDAAMNKHAASTDFEEKARLAKESALIILNDVPKLPLALRISKHYWWPWVRNYYGEWSVHDNPGPYGLFFAWFDKSLKKQMGY